MRIEGSGAAGMTTPSAQPASTAADLVRLAQAQGTASDAFVLPSPDKVVTVKPEPLGGGLDGTAYRIPDGASFDTIRLVTVDGQLVLALVQPDGTVFVLEGTGPASGSSAGTGSVEVSLPNLIVGEVEIPRETLIAAFQNNGIQPAAGDTGGESSGGNFEELVPGIGPGLNISALLGETELGVDALQRRLPGDDNNNGLGLLGRASLSGLLGPSFTAGLIGLDNTTIRDGGGNPISGSFTSGTVEVDQARTPFGTAGSIGPDVRVLEVLFKTGSAATTISFGALLPKNVDINGDGPKDIVWERVSPTEIVGKIAQDKDGLFDDVAVRLTIVGPTTFQPSDAPQTVSVKVELFSGLPDIFGGGKGTFDLGQVELIATSSVSSTSGTIDIKVVDDVPQAGFTIGFGEGEGSGTFLALWHDETQNPEQGSLDGAPAQAVGGLASGPTHDPLGWSSLDLNTFINDTSKFGADNGPTASVVYQLSQGTGAEFRGVDSGLRGLDANGVYRPIYLYSEIVKVDGKDTVVVVGREGVEGKDPAGKVAFVLVIDKDNVLTLVQYEAIDHSAPQGSEDPNGDISEGVSGLLTGGFGGLLHLTQVVTDSDGDIAKATSPISLEIRFQDDGPTPINGSGTLLGMTVREDGLGQGDGTPDNAVGNPDQPADFAGTSDETGGLAGSLGALFNPGVDKPLTYSLTEQVQAMNLPRLLSGGVEVVYHVETPEGGVPTLVATAGPDGPVVFTFSVGANGSWSFDLVGQLDHVPGQGANSALQTVGSETGVPAIDLSGAVTATDNDGDSVTAARGAFAITVTDDLPELAASASVDVTVHEDGLQVGNGDAVTGNPDTPEDAAGTSDETTITTASLQALVKTGADAPVTFALNTAATGDVTTQGGAIVTSNGHALTWGNEGGKVIAYYMDGEAKHVVLAIGQTEGGFSVDLMDRVDHAAGSGENGILKIALNSVFTAEDFDKDPVDLSQAVITVSVGNDVPVGNPDGEGSISVAIEEEALSNFVLATGAGSNGNQDGDDAPGVTPAAELSQPAGSLSGLFVAGADVPLTIKLVDTPEALASLPQLLSRGEPVTYVVTHGPGEDVLRAFVDGDTPRDVFTLTVKTDGSWTFKLLDQLDHTQDAPGENFELQTSGNDAPSAIDFTGLIQATDKDGDTAVLDGTGAHFAVAVQDDVPVMATSYTPVTGEVDESALADANVDDGQPGEVPGTMSLVVTGALAGLVSVGSDEFADTKGAHFAFDETIGVLAGVTSGGNEISITFSDDHTQLFAKTVDGDVFTITLTADGSFTFTLQGPIDHAAGQGENDAILDIGHLFQAVDADGDTLSLTSASVQITVQDDVPVGNPDGNGSILVSVEEEGLANHDADTGAGSNGNPDDQDGGEGYPDPTGASADQSALTGGPLTGLFKPGADTPITIGLKSTIGENDLPQLLSRGEKVSYEVIHNEGAGEDVLRAYVAGETPREVFTLTVKTDGSWSFQLLDQLDHTQDTPGENFELATFGGGSEPAIDFTQILTATDKDGDTATLDGTGAHFAVAVQDDVPVLVDDAEPLAFTLDESGLNSAYSVGNPDADRPGEIEGDGKVSFEGDLARFVSVGADEFADTKGAHFTFVNEPSIELFSRGEPIGFEQDGDTLTATAGGRPVFTITLAENGHFTFTLIDQIDHDNSPANSETEFTFNIGGLFQAVDADGDVLPLTDAPIAVTIQDDIPVMAASYTPVVISVDESGLRYENGNESDGNPDGHPLRPGEIAGNDKTVVSGELNVANFVKVGADEVDGGGAKFQLNANACGETDLSSRGDRITIEIVDGVLKATAGSGDTLRTVFTLTVDASGHFEFTLNDQIDHDSLNGQLGDDSESPIVNGDFTFAIGHFIQAVDADGDTLTLPSDAVQVKVQDDIPVLVGGDGQHDGDDDHHEGGDDNHDGEDDHHDGEDDHHDGEDDNHDGEDDHHDGEDDHHDGEDDHHDGEDDNHDGEDDNHSSSTNSATFEVSESKGDDGQGGRSEGNLQRFVKVGADEFDFGGFKGAMFTLKDTSTPVDSGLTVDGKPVMIVVENGVLRGVVAGGGSSGDEGDDHCSTDGDSEETKSKGSSDESKGSEGSDGEHQGGGETRTVFTFTVAPNGDFVFQMVGHLDHADGEEHNGVAPLVDLSRFVVASDFDGDSVTLAKGMVTFQVIDDVPTPTGEKIAEFVDERGLPDGNHGSDSFVTTVSGDLQVLVNAGADATDAGAIFSLKVPGGAEDTGVKSGGVPVTVSIVGGILVGAANGHTVFELEVGKDGAYEFRLLEAIDHPKAGMDSLPIDLSRYIVAEDTDHDPLTFGAGTFVVTVKDDTPIASSGSVSANVDESALPNGNRDLVSDTTQAKGSLQALVSVGADDKSGAAVFSLVSATNVATGLKSGGVDIKATTSGDTLTAKAGATTVFTLKLLPNGSYEFNLLKPIDHKEEFGSASQDKVTIDLSGFIAAKDSDGDSITLAAKAFTIGINDDVPSAEFDKSKFISMSVEESALRTASTVATGSVAGLFRVGADQANASFAVKHFYTQGDLPPLYSNGVKLDYAVQNGVLQATAASVLVFTLAVQPSGAFTFTLLQPLDHVKGNGANYALVSGADGKSTIDAINFSAMLVVKDGDSDVGVTSAENSLRISIHDDVPNFVTADATAKLNATSGSVSGDIYFNAGADKNVGALTNGSAVTFVPGTGTTGVTSGGAAVKYNLSADGKTLTGYVDTNTNGKFDDSEKVFVAKVNSGTGDTYSFEQFKTIDLPGKTTTSIIDGNGAYGSGPQDYLPLKSGSTTVAIITGYELDSDNQTSFLNAWYKTGSWSQGGWLDDKKVNGSEQGFGVDNNNLDKGEFMRVDFHDKDFDGPSGFNGPTVTTATFQLENYKSSDDIVKYVIYFENGSKETGLVSSDTFTVKSATGSLPIDYIEFFQEKGSVKLDLVNVNTYDKAGGSVGLEFDVQKSDADGDTAAGKFSVTVTGDSIDQTAPLDGNSASKSVILGGDGHEILTGTGGDDILIGNLGADTMSGGAGKDVFKLTDLSAKDLIADYKSGEDTIDLTGLFSKAASAPISDYVSYNKTTGALSVDADGAGTAAAPVTVAIIDTTPSVHPTSVTIVYDDHNHAHQTTNVG